MLKLVDMKKDIGKKTNDTHFNIDIKKRRDE